MRWLLIMPIASGCGLYEPCEPYIDYRTTMYEPQAPGLDGEGCPSLMFVEEPVPVEWYPESTIAFVRECHDDSRNALLRARVDDVDHPRVINARPTSTPVSIS